MVRLSGFGYVYTVSVSDFRHWWVEWFGGRLEGTEKELLVSLLYICI